MRPAIRVVMSFVACFGAAFIGFLFVDSSVTSWYAALKKPALTPPDMTFAVVWTILYVLMALALALVWTQNPPKELTHGWVRFFFVQLLFNATFTVFFFGFHAVLIAFVDLLFLGFIVTSLIACAGQVDRRAGYLLTPYILWILFAMYLTLGIWFLN